MIAKTHSCTLVGIEAVSVEVEADISFGLPAFNMVGLAQAAVRESKERVRTAINNSGYTFPMDRVVVNLAPADVQKAGTGLDLPVAVAILGAAGLMAKENLAAYLFYGELSLDGNLKPVKGVLPLVLSAREKGFKGVFIPEGNADEAALVNGPDILPLTCLGQVVAYFTGHQPIMPHGRSTAPRQIPDSASPWDLADVKGQSHAKRALEIAAAGSHHLLMTGPPGSGKSMLAKRLSTVLPTPSFEESIQVSRIYSVMGLLDRKHPGVASRPFRSPHHTISDAGLIGGGPRPVPGEVSLAHHGVLFMDELPEFRRNVLEVLRQPLEDGKVTIVRAGLSATFPCRFMLVAAMNPCICGLLSDPDGNCTCTASQVRAYRSKISGPLLDRLDLQVEVPRVKFKELLSRAPGETSEQVRQRVEAVRKIQEDRFETLDIFSNAGMGAREINRFCRLDSQCERLLERASDTLGLSARACHSVLKVARTISDLDDSQNIASRHMAEALQYRGFDRAIR